MATNGDADSDPPSDLSFVQRWRPPNSPFFYFIFFAFRSSKLDLRFGEHAKLRRPSSSSDSRLRRQEHQSKPRPPSKLQDLALVLLLLPYSNSGQISAFEFAFSRASVDILNRQHPFAASFTSDSSRDPPWPPGASPFFNRTILCFLDKSTRFITSRHAQLLAGNFL